MNNKPKYLVRPDDLEVFSLNSDEKTYSVDSAKKEFPRNLHAEFAYETLIKIDFYPIKENQLRKIRIRRKKEESFIKLICNDEDE